MMQQAMTGKIAVITGAARGLGAAMAELFVAEGWRVVIADLREEEGTALANQLGPKARFQRCDVSSRDDVQALVDHAISEFGGLDAMVNNAGLSDNTFGPLLEADFGGFERIMAVNVKGAMLGTQIAARHMAAHGGGSVINISSISGVRPGFGFFSYRASKAAVINFTQSAASELGAHLVRVNCVCPGNIPTEMGTFAQSPGHKRGESRTHRRGDSRRRGWTGNRSSGRAARAISPRRCCSSPATVRRKSPGQVLSVDGGSAATDSRSQIADIMAARADAEAKPG